MLLRAHDYAEVLDYTSHILPQYPHRTAHAMYVVTLISLWIHNIYMYGVWKSQCMYSPFAC